MKFLKKFNESILTKSQIVDKLVSLATDLQNFMIEYNKNTNSNLNFSFSYGEYTIHETFNFLKNLNVNSFDGEIRAACYEGLKFKNAFINWRKYYLDLAIDNRSEFENLPISEILSNYRKRFDSMPINMLIEMKYYYFVEDILSIIRGTIYNYDNFESRILSDEDVEFIESIFLNLTDLDYEYELVKKSKYRPNVRIKLPTKSQVLSNRLVNSTEFKDVLYSLNSFFGGVIKIINYDCIILSLPFIH